jgi:hypothetical protein
MKRNTVITRDALLYRATQWLVLQQLRTVALYFALDITMTLAWEGVAHVRSLRTYAREVDIWAHV